MSDLTPEIPADDDQTPAVEVESQVDEIPEDESTDDVEKLRASLQKARREARNLRERAKASESELEEYRALKESQKTAEEKRQEEHEATLARAAELERELKVRDIAAEHELPADVVKLLSLMHGASDEELAEAAQTLKGRITSGTDQTNPGQRRFGAGDPKTAAAEQFFGAGLI